MLFALYAFPRRGDRLSLEGAILERDGHKAFSEIPTFDQPRGRLPHLVGLALAALRDPELPVDVRRNIAAECVHAYVRAMEPNIYAAVSETLYSQEKL